MFVGGAALEFLDEAGGRTYLFTTELAVDWGFVGFGEYFTRLACLLDIMEPNAELYNLVHKLLVPSGEEFSRGWPNDPESVPSAPIPRLEVHSEENSGETKAEALHLITDQPGILRDKWVFHKGDDDFFPSVPHGHLKGQAPVKLDAYRGYTYDTAQGNTALAREKRGFIVGLWRDKKFCDFARASVTHFVEHHPYFDWWGQRGIRHPLRLPWR
jgi:hypothetical protein